MTALSRFMLVEGLMIFNLVAKYIDIIQKNLNLVIIDTFASHNKVLHWCWCSKKWFRKLISIVL